MTPREQIMRPLLGKPAGQAVVGSILSAVTYEMMERCGIYWPEAHKDPDKMVKLAAQAVEICGWASLKLPFDMMVETEALGGGVDYGDKGTLPQAKGHLLRWGEGFRMPRDFAERGRVPLVCRAVKIAKETMPDYAVVASVVGPFALAGKLYGTDEALMATILTPAELETTLAAVTGCVIEYANRLADAGADIILMGDPTSSNDLISPPAYERFVMPCHSRVAQSVNAPVVLHVCGCVDGNLPFYAKTGLAGLSFDYKTDHALARRHLKGNMAMIGWVDPLGVLWKGTEREAYTASMDCLNNGADILTPGCALSPATPLYNLLAMTKAANDYNRAVTS